MSDPSLAVSHRSIASHDFEKSQRSRSSLQRLRPILAPSPKDLRSPKRPKLKILWPKPLTWAKAAGIGVVASNIATCTLEEIASCSPDPRWFQLFLIILFRSISLVKYIGGSARHRGRR